MNAYLSVLLLFMDKNLIIEQVSKETNIKEKQINAVLDLLAEDATVPFIARYRKEATGALNEDQIRLISDLYNYQVNLAKRKEDVIRLIDEKGLLTEELQNEILKAEKLIDVEDLYRPFKEKKKTKATEAIKLGLEPLAKLMLENNYNKDKQVLVKPFINEKTESYEKCVEGAKYIIAEMVSDNANYRKYIREKSLMYGTISSKLKKNAVDGDEKFKIYYDNCEKLKYVKPHRILAMNRGEDLGILQVSISLQPDYDLQYLNYQVTKNKHILFLDEVIDAIADSYKRLISPSIEREIRSMITEDAEKKAIDIFSLNVKNLLLQPPLKDRVVLGVDPAFRTGCKLAVIDQTGKVLEIGVIYPNEKAKGQTVDEKLLKKSEDTILRLCVKYDVEIIAIGNGTASRETESFIADVIKKHKLNLKYIIVSEAGASVYSASEVAKEEFPDFEVQERSAVSIARRIQDPLAELVKIDPKSIGVGQYQHDVNQKELAESLDNVVTDVVNNIGVNINTASTSLLTYVSGLSKTQAKNIVEYRNQKGAIQSRKEIEKIKGIGPKTYTQAIGFLRISDAKNKLDMTSIHPESYEKAIKLLDFMGLTTDSIGQDEIKDKVKELDKNGVLNTIDIDSYTLDDICNAFCQPLRDIRDEYPTPELRQDILHLEDLKVGDILNGTIRNVIDFGCFVDLGVKYDGLLHISKMSKDKINHPSDLLSVGDLVKVRVIDIDVKRHRIQLELI